jgi:hypothetical protein
VWEFKLHGQWRKRHPRDGQAQQGRAVKVDGILALRGTGAGLWPRGAASAVAQLRNEWQV